MAATSDHPRFPRRSGDGSKPRSGRTGGSNTNGSSYRQRQQQQEERGRPRLVDQRDHDELQTNEPTLLPQNDMAERALIGSALIDETVLETCGFVKPQYFFRHQHTTVWRAMQELYAANTSIDLITLYEALRNDGQLDDPSIHEVLGYGTGVPHSEHAKDYARIVCEKYVSRYSLTANATLAAAGYRGDLQEIASAWALSQAEMQEVFTALGIAPDGSASEPRHRLKSLTEMRSRPRPDWIIPGILQERKRSLVFGDSNTGKSFIALDMGLCIATGLPWHGRATKWGPVVYVCAEGGDGITARVDVWLANHKLDDAPHFWVIDDSPNLLELGEVSGVIAQIKATLLDEPPALVIFDTLAASMPGGDENGPLDMGLAIGAIHRVQRECDCGVMVVHHTGKDPTKGPRGNSLLRADVDIALEVRMDEETGVIAMHGDKMRDSDKRKVNIGFRLASRTVNEQADFTSCIVEALDGPPPPISAPDQRKARGQTTAPDKLFALMQEVNQILRYGEWQRLFVERKIGSPKTFEAAFKSLQNRHVLQNLNGGICPVETRET